jgi:hypothetical protein
MDRVKIPVILMNLMILEHLFANSAKIYVHPVTMESLVLLVKLDKFYTMIVILLNVPPIHI